MPYNDELQIQNYLEEHPIVLKASICDFNSCILYSLYLDRSFGIILVNILSQKRNCSRLHFIPPLYPFSSICATFYTYNFIDSAAKLAYNKCLK